MWIWLSRHCVSFNPLNLLTAISRVHCNSAALQAVYRSSPFFWAFRQASAQLSTPVGVPSGGVRAGDPFAAAVFAITDALPFYDVGAVTQIFSNVCRRAAAAISRPRRLVPPPLVVCCPPSSQGD
eukprot:2951282-Pleurochrysis_carterae.AAC.1